MKTYDEILLDYIRKNYPEIENSLSFKLYLCVARLEEGLAAFTESMVQSAKTFEETLRECEKGKEVNQE